MFLQLLLSHATKYIVICDKGVMPLNSSKPFKSNNDRMLYDTLIEYSNEFQAMDGFYRMIGIIYNYIKVYEIKRHCMPPVTEIKLFFATNIIAKFGLGGFHFGIFDLATDFDEGLNHHWAIICSFDIKKIIESIEKELYDYDEQDYIINRSTSFVLMAYITLLFEFILLQIELDRWHWAKGDQFERCIKTLLPNHKNNFRCMFFKDEIDNLNVNFELPEIFNQTLTYEQAVNYVQDKNGNPICIHEVYSCNEILQSLTLYFERFMLNDEKYIQYLASGRRTLSDIMIWTLSRNKNIFLLNEIAQDLYFIQHIKDSILLRRYISKYEYFFILNANLSDDYSFNEWKEDTLAYEREMLTFDQVQKLFLLNKWNI